MKLSIIICVYNMADYIDKCLESVVNQLTDDCEVILINDGSQDQSIQKCNRWTEQYHQIRVVDKENEGLGASRNLGVKIATGEYVTFLDADDWLSGNYVTKMLEGTQDGYNDIVICDMQFVTRVNDAFVEKTSRVRLEQGQLELDKTKNLLSKSRTFMTAKLFRRSMFEEHQVKIPAHPYEDIATVPYLIAKAEHIYCQHGGLYCYLRNRDGSIVNDFSKLHYTIKSIEELLGLFEKEGIFEKNKTQLRNLVWGQVCHIWNVTRGKFADSHCEKIKHIRTGMLECFHRFFPEARKLLELKFMIVGNELLLSAVQHIVLEKTQIVSKEYEADYIVIDNEALDRVEIAKESDRIIPLILEKEKDAEEISWNAAEELLDKVIGV